MGPSDMDIPWNRQMTWNTGSSDMGHGYFLKSTGDMGPSEMDIS